MEWRSYIDDFWRAVSLSIDGCTDLRRAQALRDAKNVIVNIAHYCDQNRLNGHESHIDLAVEFVQSAPCHDTHRLFDFSETLPEDLYKQGMLIAKEGLRILQF